MEHCLKEGFSSGDIFPLSFQFSSVQLLSRVRLFATHESQHARPPCPSPSPGVHSDSTSNESVMPSSHLILCRPLLLLPPIPPSFRVFSNESTLLIRCPKYWSFSLSFIPSKEIPGLIFRMDWLDLLSSHCNNGKKKTCFSEPQFLQNEGKWKSLLFEFSFSLSFFSDFFCLHLYC